jgi:hypothetical protein
MNDHTADSAAERKQREHISKTMGWWSPAGFDAYPEKTDKVLARIASETNEAVIDELKKLRLVAGDAGGFLPGIQVVSQRHISDRLSTLQRQDSANHEEQVEAYKKGYIDGQIDGIKH